MQERTPQDSKIDPQATVPRASRLVPTLTVIYHPELPVLGRQLPVTPEAPVELGRGAEVLGPNALDDGRLSRRHCVIRAEGRAEVVVEDQQSRNGTAVNGRRVSSATLRHGDVITLGKLTLLYTLQPRGFAPAPTPKGASVPTLLVALTALIPAAEAAEPAAELPVTAQVPAFVGLDRSGAPLSESSPATLVSVTTGRAMDAQLKPRPAGALELTSALSPARRAAALQLGVSGAIAAGLESDVALVGAARLTYRRPDPAWNAPGLTVAAARVASFDGGQLDALGHDTTSVWVSGGLPLQARAQLTLGLSGARSDADLRSCPGIRLVGEVRSCSGTRIDDDGVAEGDEPCDS